jgi:hypothetical protein
MQDGVASRSTARADATPRGRRSGAGRAIAFCRRFLDDYSKPDFDVVARAFAPDASVATRRWTRREKGAGADADRERSSSSRRRSVARAGALLEEDRRRTDRAGRRPDRDGLGAVPRRLRRRLGHGVDLFQLARVGGEWQITALAWTFRRGAK